MTGVRRVGVIGAGTMGAGIAAHAASAGLGVVLLDIVPDGARTALVERLAKARPAAFMRAGRRPAHDAGQSVDDVGAAGRLRLGDRGGDRGPAVKNDVYARVRAAAPGAVLTSNTSTIPLGELQCDGITHFFNPPRYLRLLEVVGDEHALADVIACADERLGKTVVLCSDAPGFIANRLGAMWIDVALAEAVARGLDVELADAAVARAFGSPKTGVFGLLDLVGIDLSLDVTRSLAARLAPDDPLHAVERPMALMERSSRGPHRPQGRRRLLPARPRPHEARARPGDGPATGRRAGIAATSPPVLPSRPSCATARSRTRRRILDEVSGDPGAVDLAMETGYAWRAGRSRCSAAAAAARGGGRASARWPT